MFVAEVGLNHMGRSGTPVELGEFMGSIIEQEAKHLSGGTITLDGGLSQYVF